jgi:hypothetical protein
MATTTNYGWTTPDDTALVKDGASAIRTLGTSVDTTTKNLNPSTTLGDIEYRSSTANVNTRLPLGTAGQVLKVNSGATAPEWSSDNAGMTNPMTTTGDTIYSSSGSTPARLGIGSTGNVLTVAGGVPTWAAPAAGGGSYTLLNTGGTALTGASTITVSFSAYAQIFAYVDSATTGSSGLPDFNWKLNGDATAGNYYCTGVKFTGGAAGNINASNIFPACGTGASVDAVGDAYINLFNGNSTVAAKPVWFSGSGGYSNAKSYSGSGTYKGTSTITSIAIVSSSGNFTGGTIYVYGAN